MSGHPKGKDIFPNIQPAASAQLFPAVQQMGDVLGCVKKSQGDWEMDTTASR